MVTQALWQIMSGLAVKSPVTVADQSVVYLEQVALALFQIAIT